MIEQKNKAWYIARRGELLAQEFLLELEPCSLSPMQDLDLGIDYMAFFQKADGTIVVTAVEVKATEREIKDRYSYSSAQAKRLLSMNIPVLILVIDVKATTVYFNWIRNAISSDQREMLDKTSTCSITLRTSTEQERQQLKREILNL